jgi:DNA uptake protein ComE-like DNA-binding protein
MKLSVMAARDSAAQKRIVAAATQIAERYGVNLPDGVVGNHRGTVAEVAMKQREAIAQFLESMAMLDPQPAPLALKDVIRQASDEELLALPGVGQATLKALREGLRQ